MRTLNRSAFVVRPREPYLRWAAGLDADAPAAVKTLRSRVAIYLVPEDPSGHAETPPLREYYATIFRAELEAWSMDESQWPVRRDFPTFLRWFDVQGESMVIDLASGPFETEEL